MKKERSVRILVLRLLVVGFCGAILIQLASTSTTTSYRETAVAQSHVVVETPIVQGMIYDRNFRPLVNDTEAEIAVVNPTAEAVEALLPHLKDPDAFYDQLVYGTPFCCAVDTADIASEDVLVFSVPVRNAPHQMAQHLIGYTQEGIGVEGLEYEYDTFLRSIAARTSVTYAIDGAGHVLPGEKAVIRNAPNVTEGVVTTLDRDVQEICERAGAALQKGCVVVMKADTGELLGSASFPTYDQDHLEEALTAADSPLINRVLYAYPVGSIFKLLTAAVALESDQASFLYRCIGQISIGQQCFRCHDLAGHGKLNLQNALIYSCNPYFIALSQQLSRRSMLETALAWGFGQRNPLTDQISGAAGTLPTVEELQLPAEQANFCFGQGKLTATPLQIARMTCILANGGILPQVRLILGKTTDAHTIQGDPVSAGKRVLDADTAQQLRNMMIAAVYGNASFSGVPDGVCVGAKTSTAQTGRMDENGEEYCHGWITGFFPAHAPEYVVTVLAEDGGYGNDSAAPVFREIVEQMGAIGLGSH